MLFDGHMKRGFVYIVSNKSRSVLYVGVTSDIVGRIWEHKNEVYEDSFTKRYHAHDLIFLEEYDDIADAISREKELKGWRRQRKFWLVTKQNPNMIELYNEEFIKDHS